MQLLVKCFHKFYLVFYEVVMVEFDVCRNFFRLNHFFIIFFNLVNIGQNNPGNNNNTNTPTPQSTASQATCNKYNSTDTTIQYQ